MTTITPDTVLVRAPELVAVDMDGEVVMMSVQRGEYFGLGAVGGRVWSLIEKPSSLREIAQVLCAEYEVDESACLADLLPFAADLIQNGIAKAA
ncbi:MAG: lasso peptide biosynthesis PqqD family chaperone [Elusimicrobia bacterium]|nr:lasso peptide biosynthesis PqqD family chaperone [Elusimicrobiota bacterium]MDE2237355.1 lasso peptide biosynthesis PqqD family chaperone [Elusimicrobiota bacterium]MDE2425297.1 lasso peptide biosynthesis PqqD family chaperone [Elusimicrobiota bacterium]